MNVSLLYNWILGIWCCYFVVTGIGDAIQACPHPHQTWYDECGGGCYFMSPLDCAGSCNKTSAIDCTGNCVLLQDQTSVDRCGVCGGDGMSCVDCAGVFHGISQYDNCGICNGNNLGCAMVTSISPTTVRNSDQIRLTLTGASFPPQRVLVNGDDVTENIESFTNSQFTVVLEKFQWYDETAYFQEETLTVEVMHRGSRLMSTFDFNFTVINEITMVQSVVNPILKTRSSNTIQLQGNHFFNYTASYCVFRDLGNAPLEVSPLTVVSSNLVECEAPVRTYSRTKGVLVDIVYGEYQDQSQLLPVKYAHTLYYYEPSPRVVSTKFSSEGDSIHIQFDVPIKIVFSVSNNQWRGPLEACRRFLDIGPHQGITFGLNDSDCSVEQIAANELRISFSPDFLMQSSELAPTIGDPIYLLNNTYYNALAMYSFPVQDSPTIQDSYDYEIPSVVVQGIPSTLGTCGSFILDLSETNGDGGRLFVAVNVSIMAESSEGESFQYVSNDVASEVTSSSSSSSAATSSSPLVSFIQTLAENITTMLSQKVTSDLRYLEVPSENVPEGNYTVQIVLENFLHRQGSVEFSFTKLNQSNVPFVLFQCPESIRVGQPLILQAVIQDECSLPNYQVAVSWGDLYPNSFEFRSNVYTLPFSQRTLAEVLIPPYSLLPGVSYSVDVSVAYMNMLRNTSPDPMPFYSTTLNFYVEQSTLNISLGEEITQSAYNPLKITAQIIDEQNALMGFDPSQYLIEWVCYTPNNGYDCFDSSTGEVLALPNALTVVLGPDVLGFDVYHFVASVLHQPTGRRSISPVLTVNRQDRTMPSVSLEISDPNPSKDSEVVFTASVWDVNVDDDRLMFSWISKPECNGDTFSTLNLYDTQVYALKKRRILKLNAGVLKPSAQYCITVVAYDPTLKNEAEASVTFQVAPVPAGGLCGLLGENATGMSYETKWSFMCDGWEGVSAEKQPLLYSWEAKPAQAGDDQYVVLDPLDYSTELSVLFPPGEWTVRANVVDSSGSHNMKPQLLTITSLENTNASLGDAFLQLRNEYNLHRLARGFLQGLSSLAMGLSSISSPTERLNLDWMFTNELNSLMPQIWVTPSNTKQILGILSSISPNSLDNLSIQQSFIYILKALINGNAQNPSSQNTFLDLTTATLINNMLNDALTRFQSNSGANPTLSTLHPKPHLKSRKRALEEAPPSLFGVLEGALGVLDQYMLTKLECGEQFSFQRSGYVKNLLVAEVSLLGGGGVSQICNVSVHHELLKSFQDAQGCISVMCVTTAATGIFNYNGDLQLNPIALELLAMDASQQKMVSETEMTYRLIELQDKINGSGSSNTLVTLSPPFMTQVPIHPWFESTLEINTTCAVYDVSEQSWDNSKCQLISFNKQQLLAQCSCSQWGMVTIASDPNYGNDGLSGQGLEEGEGIDVSFSALPSPSSSSSPAESSSSISWMTNTFPCLECLFMTLLFWHLY